MSSYTDTNFIIIYDNIDEIEEMNLSLYRAAIYMAQR